MPGEVRPGYSLCSHKQATGVDTFESNTGREGPGKIVYGYVIFQFPSESIALWST